MDSYLCQINFFNATILFYSVSKNIIKCTHRHQGINFFHQEKKEKLILKKKLNKKNKNSDQS
jgi:hypothetical protein